MGRWPAQSDAAAVLVDIRNPHLVFAAGPAGLFRSPDAGRTWNPVSIPSAGGGLVALAQNPRFPQRLFALAADGTLMASENGGDTWQRVPQ